MTCLTWSTCPKVTKKNFFHPHHLSITVLYRYLESDLKKKYLRVITWQHLQVLCCCHFLAPNSKSSPICHLGSLPLGLPSTRHIEPENLKKSRAKKLVKSNKSIHKKKFWPNSTFCNFKNGQKLIFDLGKSLKQPEMQFHEKNKLIYSISRVFLPGIL